MSRPVASIAGVGSTPYYFRGGSAPQTIYELIGKAVLAALDDAGLTVSDVDGMAFYAHGYEAAQIVEQLGIPELSFAAIVSGQGGGSAGILDLAAMAVETRRARAVVCIGACQQIGNRYGQSLASLATTPQGVLSLTAGLTGPGQSLALVLRQKPMDIVGAVHGGKREWGRAFFWLNQPDDVFASAGAVAVAEQLYRRTGLGAADIDVALLYDHFSPLVILQLEDYGFCERGEGGAFVESGAIRPGGPLAVNPHGGQLAECYVIGMTHIREAVEQLRGRAINQVPDARLALVTGGPAPIPMSAAILGV